MDREDFTLEGNDPFTTITRNISVSTSTGGKLSFDNAENDRVGALLDNVKLGRNVRQGTLLATVRFNRVTRAFGYGYGYGYGYLGQDGAGQIEYDLFYTPPPIAGDYRATIQVVTPFQTVSFFTEFSVLKALTATALTTLYPRSDVEALDGDLAILQLDVSQKTKNIFKVDVSQDLMPQTPLNDSCSEVPPGSAEEVGGF